MFNQRVGSTGQVRVSNNSPGLNSSANHDLVPKSNFFGGTFQRQSDSPSMMQTKTNE